jgi:hypothetical protein
LSGDAYRWPECIWWPSRFLDLRYYQVQKRARTQQQQAAAARAYSGERLTTRLRECWVVGQVPIRTKSAHMNVSPELITDIFQRELA